MPTSVALLALFALLPVSVDSDATQLDEIERAYAKDADPAWEPQAEAIAARARPAVAARALLWLGARAFQDGRLDRARVCFQGAREWVRRGPSAALAARGLGDIALARHAWREAIAHFDDALAQGDPVLARELDEKRARAIRELVLLAAEWAAWLVLALYLVRSIHALRGVPFHAPVETRLLAPIYALIAFVAWGRDPEVPYAILYIGLGSLALITLGCAAPRGRRSRGSDVSWMVLGNVAVFYVALRRAGVVDALWETLKFGTDMG